MKHPPFAALDQVNTHRLVPARDGESVLVRIADDNAHLAALFELDGATNDRLLAEHGRAPGIGPEELLASVPHASIVNAAFCHPHPLGARFSGPDRGAWYAAFEVATARAEIGFHKSVELAEVGWLDESITFDDYLADFTGDFHDLRDARGFGPCLAPDSYVASQALADDLLDTGSLGIVYPSLRRPGGICLACFRPALVTHVRKGRRWRFTWRGGEGPVVQRAR